MIFFLFAFTLLGQVEHQKHHPPRSAAEYAKTLENPKRDEWQKPHEVLQALKLRKDEVVADIGAGSGYFTRRLAHHAAKVFAVDIDPKLLELAAKGGSNIEPILADANDPKLPPAGVDTVFICDVLHHIEQRPAYYAKLQTALKPGGRIVIIDFFKKKLPVGPPEGMKLDQHQVIAELEDAGFRRVESHAFLPYQYFLVFHR